MAPPPSSNAGIVRTVIHRPMKNRENSGTYDDSVRTTEQIPSEARFEGAPQVPSTAKTRKPTSARPVYDDFATAHSSITSRSASGRSRDMSRKSPKRQSGRLDRGRPLPRRAIKSLRRQKKHAKDEVLTQPMASKVSGHRPISGLDFDISDAHFKPGQQNVSRSSFDPSMNVVPQKTASGSPLFDTLKKAISGKSLPAAKLFQNRHSDTLKWPRDGMGLSSLAHKAVQPTMKGPEVGQAAKRNPQQSHETRLLDLSLYMDDPFVYDAGQKATSNEQIGMTGNQESDDAQPYREITHVQGNHNQSAGLRTSHGTPVTQTHETPNHSHCGLDLTQRVVSTREGSTVDNIVKEYATNNGLWDISLDSNDEDEDSDDDIGYLERSWTPTRPQKGKFDGRVSGTDGEIGDKRPFRAFKLMDSSGIVPSAFLPQVPSLLEQQTLKSRSEGPGQTSSYGDTRNLLDITQHSQWVNASSHPNLQETIIPRLKYTAAVNTNPFRRGSNQNPVSPSIAVANPSPNSSPSQNITLDTSDGTEKIAGMPSLALERDISRALRHMSAISNSSQYIPAHYQGDGGLQSSTDSSGFLSFIGKPMIGHVIEPTKFATRGFYHESAIRQAWLDSQSTERVRIPIRRNVSASSVLPMSHSSSSTTGEGDLEMLDGLDQNATEWETVVDGAMSRVKTAGSSLANNSSAGSTSQIVYEHHDFLSTDRIIQHPAQIDYSHDYRYRQIKEGNFPVLLPSYRPHTVNGFPANSYRPISHFQQNGNLYQSPPPLSKSHTNPFRSPPPEVITNKSKFSEAVGHDKLLVEQPPRLKLASSQAANGNLSAHWMDEFGDPGPAIRPAAPNLDMEAGYYLTYSPSESCSGSQAIGSSIADASSSALSTIIHDLVDLQDDPKYGLSKFNYGAELVDDTGPIACERAMFVKGPPGTFYQGVRSRPDPRRKDSPKDCEVATKLAKRKQVKTYPTNEMRPLSLLQVQYAGQLAGQDESRLGVRLNDHFFKRLPLAPIKSKSWCNLYTREQLCSMNSGAKSDGTNDIGHLPRRSSRPLSGEALELDGSWKRTWSPHLRHWPRDNSSTTSDLSGRKQKISSLIFGLCCLFPPMLVLYGIGYLDSSMLWITQGEISSFSKTHKKAALRVACIFIIALLISVCIVVTLKVKASK